MTDCPIFRASFPEGSSSGPLSEGRLFTAAVLLADEPTGNLDRKNSEEILALLKLSNKRYHQTIVLITHDERIALEADRVITIEDGRILQDSRQSGGEWRV